MPDTEYRYSDESACAVAAFLEHWHARPVRITTERWRFTDEDWSEGQPYPRAWDRAAYNAAYYGEGIYGYGRYGEVADYLEGYAEEA